MGTKTGAAKAKQGGKTKPATARSPRGKRKATTISKTNYQTAEADTTCGTNKDTKCQTTQGKGKATRKEGIRGRTSSYTDEIGDKICDGLEEGLSLRAITEADTSLPNERTIRRWIRAELHPFCPKYASARETGLEKIGDDVLSLAKSANADNHQAIKIQIDAAKWYLSKLAPKTFGDRAHMQIESKVEVIAAMPSDVELARLLAAAMDEANQQAPIELEVLSDTG